MIEEQDYEVQGDPAPYAEEPEINNRSNKDYWTMVLIVLMIISAGILVVVNIIRY